MEYEIFRDYSDDDSNLKYSGFIIVIQFESNEN